MIAWANCRRLESDIQKYIVVCEGALDLITLERRKLLSGETKNYLTEWWLHLIRDEVERCALCFNIYWVLAW